MNSESGVPADFEVQPINIDDPTAISPATCGNCGLTWDDGIMERRHMYRVSIITENSRIDAKGFPIGSWQEIGFWLDECGYIDPRHRVEIAITERSQLDAECISYGELAELQSRAEHIEPGDVQLLEAAGVPEFPDDVDQETEDMLRGQAAANGIPQRDALEGIPHKKGPGQ